MKKEKNINWPVLILAIILCFPLGCIAAAHAAQVAPHIAQGNTKAAELAQAEASHWCIWAYTVAILIFCILFLFFDVFSLPSVL